MSKPVYAKDPYPLCAEHRAQISLRSESGTLYDAREGELVCAYIVGFEQNRPLYCGAKAAYVLL